MEIVGYLTDLENRDRIGVKMCIQSRGQPVGRPRSAHIAMCHLSGCMDTRVGSSRAKYSRTLRVEVGEGFFQALLHALRAVLSLPTSKGSAIIFDFQRVSGHSQERQPSPSRNRIRRIGEHGQLPFRPLAA